MAKRYKELTAEETQALYDLGVDIEWKYEGRKGWTVANKAEWNDAFDWKRCFLDDKNSWPGARTRVRIDRK